MITTSCVNGDLIEQFKDDMAAHPDVDAVFRKHGKTLHLKVNKSDDGVPKPHRELGELVDGDVVADGYVVSTLVGSGHAPGDKYTHVLAVSPKCGRCGDAPAEYEDDGQGLCHDCHLHT